MISSELGVNSEDMRREEPDLLQHVLNSKSTYNNLPRLSSGVITQSTHETLIMWWQAVWRRRCDEFKSSYVNFEIRWTAEKQNMFLNLWSHNYTSTGQHSLFTAPWTLKCVINIEDINIRIMDIVSRPSLTCTAPQRAQHDLVKAWNHLQTELTIISAKDFNQAALIPHCFNVD